MSQIAEKKLTKLSKNSLTPKQLAAIKRLTSRRWTLLVAGTGEGKTAIGLTSINDLIESGKLAKVIVACPAKVVAVWPKEQTKWPHLKRLKVVALKGSPDVRRSLLAAGADVFVVSLNNLEWLLMEKHGADGIIIDEISKAAGKQTRKLNTKRWGDRFIWRVGASATPVSQDFEKLFDIARRIDKGKSLGTNKFDYLSRYFYSDYMGYNWTLKEDAPTRILSKIKKLVWLIEDEKHLTLPKLHTHTMRFDMPEATRKLYQDMKRDMIADEVIAVNAAVQTGKLRQLSSGFYYIEGSTLAEKSVRFCDNARTYSASNWIDSLKGAPGVIFYEYIGQLKLLEDVISTHTKDIEAFMAGRFDILLAQIGSLSHGVDGLQHVAHHALFLHPFWSRDQTQQAIGRLHRTGQKHEVHITTLVCEDTLDDAVLARVEGRAGWMELFTEHLKGS